jgi:DNA polymerase-3 subunit beta
MRIQIDKQTFKQAIKQPAKLAKPARTSFAVLQNIKLEARDGKLSVTGTDLDTSIRVSVPATVNEEGMVVVDAATLDKATNAPADDIIISTDKDSVTVRAGKTWHMLPKGDISEYPTIDFLNGEVDCEIDGINLGSLCRKVAYAISKDDTRKDFTGALFTVKDGKAQMVSTDGHRLAKAECEATGELEGCIVPAKAIQILSELTGAIKLHSANGKLHVMTADGVQMSISLIAGKFPDFSKVFPTSFDTTVTVDAKPLKDMLKYVGMATRKDGTVRIGIHKDTVTLGADNQKCKSNAEIPAELEGEPVSIGINGEYLSQTIEAIGESRLSIRIIDADSPMLVTGVDDSESNQHIVMPMMI